MAKDTKCITCPEYKRCRDSYASWIFFLIGLIATIAIRIVTVLIYIEPIYGKAAWYIGVAGFFIFFVYKFNINQARARVIDRRNLLNKINSQQALDKEDFEIISSILCDISSKKERVNYFFIFALSAIALVLAAYFDFFKQGV